MPLLFGILTAIVLLLSTWMGYKNQSEYKQQIKLRQKEEANYVREVGVLKDRTEEWSETIEKKEGLFAANKELGIDLEKIGDNIKDLKSEIAQKKDDKSRLAQEVTDAEEIFNKVGGIRSLIGKIKRLRSEIVTLKDDIAAGETIRNNLTQTKRDTAGLIVTNEKRVDKEASGKSQPYLKTSIKSVYKTWGFVTLNGGEMQGVVPNSILAVVRNKEIIARLKVTAVESNTAGADILRETVASGTIIRNGDSVVALDTALPQNPVKARDKKTAKN